MSADETAPSVQPLDLPTQSRRRLRPEATRTVRQLRALDAWNAARRSRERALHAVGGSRDQRLEASRELDALHRTQRALENWAAQDLARTGDPLRSGGTTAVIAHGHAWFADKMSLLLAAHGVEVLESTGNAADALAVVVFGQPDVFIVGDRLEMVTSAELLREASTFAPETVRVLHTGHAATAGGALPDAHKVFARHLPPEDIASELIALLADRSVSA